MSINSQSSKMSETVNLVRFFKVLSLSNRCDITVKAFSMGVFVNIEQHHGTQKFCLLQSLSR